MGKPKDLGHLAHIVAYDGSNHITVPNGITMHTNQLVASQEYVNAALGTYALSSALGSYVPSTRTITINGTALDLSANRSFTIAAGLTSFNTRTGAITLSSGDVTTALGFTPYNSTNPNGYITGINSTMVTNALGYTPYNSTNPSGYINSSGSISGSAGSVSGLTLTSSSNGINPDSVTQNQIGYNTSVSLFGQSDGGLYSSAYSSAWIHQIYGDFRTGQIAIRGKNNGSWTGWRTVIDSSTIGTQSVSTAMNVYNINYALGNSHYWTAINYFQSNNGYYSVNNSNSAKLQAYSTDSSSAFMSFHRGGYYAINMGLDGDNVFRIGGWSAGGNRLQMDMSGNLTMSGDITAYSDARVKENIITVDNALDKVLALRGVYYNRIDSDDKKRKIGVIAQETLTVVPEVVNTDAFGTYNVSYGNLGGLFIEAFKDQQQTINSLTNQINHLKAKIDGITR